MRVFFFRIDFNGWVWLKLFTWAQSVNGKHRIYYPETQVTLMEKSLSKLQDDLGEEVKKAITA